MSDKFITYIEKDIDNTGVLQEIDLHDRRINNTPVSPSTTNSALVFNQDGTISAQQLAYLLLTGGTLTGALAMSGNKITNLANATDNQDAVTYRQMLDAIEALGSVFRIKGMKDYISELPQSGNKVGDVWYVKEDSSAYIWLNISPPGQPEQYAWEKLGPTIDLSAYLRKADLQSTLGARTDTTLTQAAITSQINSLVAAIATKIDLPSNPQDGNILKYDATQSKWIAASTGAAIASLVPGDNSITIGGTATDKTVSVRLSNKAHNSLQVLSEIAEIHATAVKSSESFTITFNESTFLTKVASTIGTYTFTYELATTSWHLGTETVDLAEYGLSASGGISDGDTIDVTVARTVTQTPGLYTSSAQSDWTEDDPTEPSYILNKPTLGTAADKNVLAGTIKDNPSSTNLVGSSQVATYVGKYAIYIDNAPPTDPDIKFWMDTTDNKNILKYYNGSAWVVAGSKVDSVNSKTGVVVLEATDVNAVPLPNPATTQHGDVLQYNSTQSSWVGGPMTTRSIVQKIPNDTTGVNTTLYEIIDNQVNIYIIEDTLFVLTEDSSIDTSTGTCWFNTAMVDFVDDYDLLLLP